MKIHHPTQELLLRVSFPPIQGPDYDITIRVTNFTHGGSITLAYADLFEHSIILTGT